MKIDSPPLVAASATQSFGWVASTLIALYRVRNGNIIQHRRWMIENYFFAMVFTVVRLIIPIPPIIALAMTGFKIVVWSMMCSKPFLSIILLDWRTITRRPAIKQTMATALAAE